MQGAAKFLNAGVVYVGAKKQAATPQMDIFAVPFTKKTALLWAVFLFATCY